MSAKTSRHTWISLGRFFNFRLERWSFSWCRVSTKWRVPAELQLHELERAISLVISYRLKFKFGDFTSGFCMRKLCIFIYMHLYLWVSLRLQITPNKDTLSLSVKTNDWWAKIWYFYYTQGNVLTYTHWTLCCTKLGFGENIDWVSYKEGVALSKQR